MAAHPVELVEVDGMLAQHDRPDLERSGDKAAPERQDEDVMGAQPPGRETWFGWACRGGLREDIEPGRSSSLGSFRLPTLRDLFLRRSFRD